MGAVEVTDLDVRMWCFTFNMGACVPSRATARPPAAAAHARPPCLPAKALLVRRRLSWLPRPPTRLRAESRDPFRGTTPTAVLADVVPMDCDVYVIGLQVRSLRHACWCAAWVCRVPRRWPGLLMRRATVQEAADLSFFAHFEAFIKKVRTSSARLLGWLAPAPPG